MTENIDTLQNAVKEITFKSVIDPNDRSKDHIVIREEGEANTEIKVRFFDEAEIRELTSIVDEIVRKKNQSKKTNWVRKMFEHKP